MRPNICVPIVESDMEKIVKEAMLIDEMPVEFIEWRIDFFDGQMEEVLTVIEKIKENTSKKLIATLRTTNEGGEENGDKFDYESLVKMILDQNLSDYVDVETMRGIKVEENSVTKIIGSYHDFDATPSQMDMVQKLLLSKDSGYSIGKIAVMPQSKEDVDTLLKVTEKVSKDYDIITMSMGELGLPTRLYGGLYGSKLSFATRENASAPGQPSVELMKKTFDKIYKNCNHIFLIGFMGTGKSTIAKELEKITGRKVVDTDDFIEKMIGMEIKDIFASKGEEYFRKLETDILDDFGEKESLIVSCGGGMAMRDLNAKKMSSIGKVVWLDAAPDTIYERVKDSTNRPLLNGNMNVGFISELMLKRRDFYKNASDIRIETDNKSKNDIAKEILEKTSQI